MLLALSVSRRLRINAMRPTALGTASALSTRRSMSLLSTTSQMPPAILPREHLSSTPNHSFRNSLVFRHHSLPCKSMSASAAASAAAEASMSSAAANADGGMDIVPSSNKAEDEETEKLASSFDAFDLDDRVTARLPSLGIHAPTPIQARAIQHILDRNDVALRAPTGSGKTLAFLLPVLSEAIRRAELEADEALKAGKQPQPPSVQAVVVSPSRELAMQTVRVAQRLLPKEAASAVVQQAIGGANPRRQEEALKINRPLLVVGTPGRLSELSRSGALQTHHTPFLVLDEADQLLAPQFREELTRLMEQTGKKCGGGIGGSGSSGRTTVLVSATMTPRVVDAYARWTTKENNSAVASRAGQPVPSLAEAAAAVAAGLPVPRASSSSTTKPTTTRRPPPLLISTDPLVDSPKKGPSSSNPNNQAKPEWGWGASTADGIRVLGATSSSAGGVGSSQLVPTLPGTLEHAWVRADRRLRTDVLRKTVHALGASRVLVFMNAGKRLKDTQFKLSARGGMPCACLHGEMGKQARESALNDFAAGRARVLLVSDVAARGLDLPGVDAVVNLELPSDAAHYAHRAGRAGRAGTPGVVVSLVEPSEEFVMERLGKKLGVKIPMAQVAGGRVEVVEKKGGNRGGAEGSRRPLVRVLGVPPPN